MKGDFYPVSSAGVGSHGLGSDPNSPHAHLRERISPNSFTAGMPSGGGGGGGHYHGKAGGGAGGSYVLLGQPPRPRGVSTTGSRLQHEGLPEASRWLVGWLIDWLHSWLGSQIVWLVGWLVG